jgi:hypothetical protein
MPVIPWGILSLAGSTVLVVYLWVTSKLVEDDTWDKILSAWCLVWIITTAFSLPLYLKWRTEKATCLEGDLISPPQTVNHPIFAWAETQNLTWMGIPTDPVIKFVYDAGLRMRIEDHKLEVSTTVRDREGNVVVDIADNHWRVGPSPIVWDKNYTDTALEVEDRRGHVVLQITLRSNWMKIQGEWHDEHGNGARLREMPGKYGYGLLEFWLTPEKEKELSTGMIEPMFKYPSKEHWGELLPTPTRQ